MTIIGDIYIFKTLKGTNRVFEKFIWDLGLREYAAPDFTKKSGDEAKNVGFEDKGESCAGRIAEPSAYGTLPGDQGRPSHFGTPHEPCLMFLVR